jgi:hypothetical protein
LWPNLGWARTAPNSGDNSWIYSVGNVSSTKKSASSKQRSSRTAARSRQCLAQWLLRPQSLRGVRSLRSDARCHSTSTVPASGDCGPSVSKSRTSFPATNRMCSTSEVFASSGKRAPRARPQRVIPRTNNECRSGRAERPQFHAGCRARSGPSVLPRSVTCILAWGDRSDTSLRRSLAFHDSVSMLATLNGCTHRRSPPLSGRLVVDYGGAGNRKRPEAGA